MQTREQMLMSIDQPHTGAAMNMEEQDATAGQTLNDENSPEAQRLGRIAYETHEKWIFMLAPGGMTQFSQPKKWDDLYAGLRRCWVRSAMAVANARLQVPHDIKRNPPDANS